MRIGIDARELCGRPTGVGRYLTGLLTQWSIDPRARQHEFVLYAPDSLSTPLDSRRFTPRAVPGPPGTWWEQVRLPAAMRGDHLDAFFAPGYTAPLLVRVPVVAAIHDVSFVAHPEWFSAREGLRRRTLTRRTAAAARTIVTISDFTRQELIERLGVPASRVRVVPPGIDRPAVPEARDRAARVLYVGSIFNRRRVPDLIRAFGPIARAHAHATLEIVGDNRTYPRQDIRLVLEREGLGAQVRWHEYVSDADLAVFYGSARAFAFLSEYEGLGLTPLEALAVGVPGVLLETAVAREACGDAALYVPRDDLAATSRAIQQLLFDEDVRGRLLAAAPQALARYDWPRAARETLAAIEQAAVVARTE
jgi:glycosyltransferase involved in cell wall biosynthesis